MKGPVMVLKRRTVLGLHVSYVLENPRTVNQGWNFSRSPVVVSVDRAETVGMGREGD